MQGRLTVSLVIRVAATLVLLALCNSNCVVAHPSAFGSDDADVPVAQVASQTPWVPTLTQAGYEPGHVQQTSPSTGMLAVAVQLDDFSAKWADLQSRILADEATLAACRSNNDPCPAAARRFLSLVELGRRRQGRARLGEINRAVNLSIKPVSDWVQYGVEDFWAAPLATIGSGAGDCEDYAIVKYVALREAGVPADDLRLVIVRDVKHQTNHAVVAVHSDEEWLLLDNRTLIMLNVEDARNYWPLFVLDSRGARPSATVSLVR